MDPLSITTSAVSLLGVCLKVSVELKKFRQGAAQARTTVTAMLSDVKALRDVLQSMEDTFETLDSQPATGHIGTHWTNLSAQGRCRMEEGRWKSWKNCSRMPIRTSPSSMQRADIFE